MASRRAFAAGLALVVAVLGFAAFMGARSATKENGRSVARDVTIEAPCLGGDHVSLEQAAAEQQFAVQIPEATAANAASLIDVCAAVDASGLVMVYSSGVKVAESPNDLADPEAAWQALVDQYPEAGYQVTTFHGQPALEVEPGGQQPSLGAVAWVEEGVKYMITGNGKIPLQALLAVADSLEPYSSSTLTPSPSSPSPTPS